MRPTLLILALCATAAAQAQSPDWQTVGSAAYVCGGVGEASFATIRAQRDQANLEILLTAGARGSYLADVTLVIGGTALDTPLILAQEGPLCLVRLPAGHYAVSAQYSGQSLEREVDVGKTLTRVRLNFRAPAED